MGDDDCLELCYANYPLGSTTTDPAALATIPSNALLSCSRLLDLVFLATIPRHASTRKPQKHTALCPRPAAACLTYLLCVVWCVLFALLLFGSTSASLQDVCIGFCLNYCELRARKIELGTINATPKAAGSHKHVHISNLQNPTVLWRVNDGRERGEPRFSRSHSPGQAGALFRLSENGSLGN